MQLLRALFLQYRAVACLVALVALCMKLLVPSGYMIGPAYQILTIEICADASGSHVAEQIAIPLQGGSTKTESGIGECPFVSLSMSAMTDENIGLLLLALAYILALGFARTRSNLTRLPNYLRLLLRGPPSRA